MMNWVRKHMRISFLLVLIVLVVPGGLLFWNQRPKSLADHLYSRKTTYWIVLSPKQGVNRQYNQGTLPVAVVASKQGRLKVYPLSQASDRAEITLGALLKLSTPKLEAKLKGGEITSQPSDWRQFKLKVISSGDKKTAGESIVWRTLPADNGGIAQFMGHIDLAQPLAKGGRAISIAGQKINGFVNRDGMAILTKTTGRVRLDRYQDKRVTQGW